MAAKLADVARRAGVSTATASRVLNGKMVMPIPAATVERIRHAAQELDYRPNAHARALLSGRSYALGLYSREMTDPHFGQMLEAADAEARRLGYHLVVSSVLESICGEGRTDGVIFVGSPGEPRFERAPRRVPAVYVGGAVRPGPNMIAWSDAEGMHAAARHLIDLGHRRIAGLFCYGGEPAEPVPKLDGFRRAVESAGVTWRAYWHGVDPYEVRETNQFENGYVAARQLLSDWSECTAIVARNDFIALGALRAFREAGRRVPDDVSVVGYTDSVLATCADPPLTSVRTPFARAGTMAVELLARAAQAGAMRFDGVLLPTSLTVRGSCAPPRDAQAVVRTRDEGGGRSAASGAATQTPSARGG